MADYKVKLFMSEEYIINAESEKATEKQAREKFGYDYLIDNVEVTEIKQKCNYSLLSQLQEKIHSKLLSVMRFLHVNIKRFS